MTVVVSMTNLAAGVDFHAAVTGSDANPGTPAQPFATITRARDAVRSLITAGLTDDVHVIIHGGTYRITEPIVFGVEDSGTDNIAIHYEAANCETPNISGGRIIQGLSANPDGTWSAMIPEVAAGTWTFRELFVNGQRRSRARHPNGKVTNRIASAAPNQRTVIEFTEGDIPESTNLAGAEFVFFHDWSISRVAIDHANHAANTITMTDPIGPEGPIWDITYFEPNPRYYVENDLALLDAPGEWHLDDDTGVLTYKPMPGESPASIEAIAPVSEQLIIVRGIFEEHDTAPEFVKNLHFDGLHCEHSAWPLPEGGFAEYQAGFYEPRDGTPFYDWPAAVSFEQADSCSFTNGCVARSGGWGIMTGRTTQNCTINGNVVTDIAGNGIIVGEDQYRNIRNKDNIAIGQWWDIAEKQAAHHNTATNNLVEHCGKVFYGCTGIWVGITHDNTIAHNIIRNTSWSGISVGGFFDDRVTPCRDNTITQNHIHNAVEVMSDGGGIYTLGRQAGTTISQNIIHQIPLNPGLSSNVGIFLDQASTDILIEQNAVFSTVRPPVKVHIAGENTLQNNTFYRSSTSIPYILYINTTPGQLILNNNTLTTQTGVIPCDHPVYQVAPDAGLELSFLKEFIGPPAFDGCSSCTGVIYSGQFPDNCGVCQGDNTTCVGVPTMSQWATIVFVLLLMLAATIIFRLVTHSCSTAGVHWCR